MAYRQSSRVRHIMSDVVRGEDLVCVLQSCACALSGDISILIHKPLLLHLLVIFKHLVLR